MPFVLILVGLLFLVVAIRGTQGSMFALIKSEFWGSNSFVPWAAAIMILGAVGYAKPIKPIADAMIGLIILVMLLANKGEFFTALNKGLANPVAAAVTPATAPVAAPSQNFNPPALSAPSPTGYGIGQTGLGTYGGGL